MAKELHIKIDRQIGGLYIDGRLNLMAGYSYAEFDYALSNMPEPKTVVIHANSPGGDGFQSQSIYNRLQDLKKKGTKVKVINESICFSAMTYLAMSASPGMLVAWESSMFNFHKPMADPGGLSNADELRKAATQLDSFENILVSAYVARTGKSESEIKAFLREDRIINAKEALEMGWIDEVIPNEPQQVEEPELKMVALKPVAYFNNSQINNEEMITAEQEDSIATKVWNLIKTGSFQNNKTEGEQPNGENQNQEGQNQEAEKSPAELENEQLKAENERLKQELEQNKTQLTDLSNQQNQTTEQITNLKNELAEAKKFVPGGGNHAGNPPQNFKNESDTGKSVWDGIADNAKRKRK